MAHSDGHIDKFVDVLLERPDVPGVIVEAGAYKGIGTAKLSHVAAMTGRRLIVSDSFEGLPPNQEAHDRSILGHSPDGWFAEGEYSGSLDEVRETVTKFGRPEVVHYVRGWFDETMPQFNERVVAAYLDVDLASSTRTCLENLWPLLSPGGVVVSQDG